MKQWKLDNLDLAQAVNVLPVLDPQTSLRFNLPVANWLGADGAPKFPHMDKDADVSDIVNMIVWDKGRAPGAKGPEDQGKPGSWQFQFWNYKDNAMQRAKIDGSEVVRFMGPTPAQAQKIVDIVHDYARDPDLLTPDQLARILDRTHAELGLKDRFDASKSEIDDYLKSGHKYFGAFLPRMKPSSAIYIPGSGEFLDGPTATPQKFDSGAFISFMDLPDVSRMTLDDIKSLIAEKKLTVKLVQADVFSASRTLADGGRIDGKKLAAGPRPG